MKKQATCNAITAAAGWDSPAAMAAVVKHGNHGDGERKKCNNNIMWFQWSTSRHVEHTRGPEETTLAILKISDSDCGIIDDCHLHCAVQLSTIKQILLFFLFSFLLSPFPPFHFFFVLFHFTAEWVKVWQRLRACALKWKEVERSALVNWLIDWPAACYR